MTQELNEPRHPYYQKRFHNRAPKIAQSKKYIDTDLIPYYKGDDGGNGGGVDPKAGVFVFTVGDGGTVGLPSYNMTTCDLEVDWGDGTVEQITDPAATHVYASAGDYEITYTGTADDWGFRATAWITMIKEVKQFPDFDCAPGVLLNDLFYGASALTAVSAANWSVFNDRDLTAMFRGCNNLMSVTPITIQRPLELNDAFRAVPSDLDFGGVDASTVTRIDLMCNGAGSIVGLDQWDISSLTNADNVFLNSGLSSEEYTKLLIAWSAQTVQPNVALGAGTVTYDASAQAARDVLTGAPNNWIITDGGPA